MSQSLIDSQFPHCRRSDLNSAVSKGPLFDRIFEAASSFKLLLHEYDLVTCDLAELEIELKRSKAQGCPANAEGIEIKMESLKVELERLSTLIDRAKNSMPDFPIEKVTAVYTVYSGSGQLDKSYRSRACA
jgi:hypothetical protein